MFSFLKKLFKGFDPDLTESEETVSTSNGNVDYDALWEAVTAKLAKDVKTRITTPKGRGYILIASGVNKGNLTYVCGYSVRAKLASVGIETYAGEEGRSAIQAMIDDAPKKFVLKDVEAKQGVKNKSKWAWGVGTSTDASTDELVTWYAETVIELYKYFEAQKPMAISGTDAEESKDNGGKPAAPKEDNKVAEEAAKAVAEAKAAAEKAMAEAKAAAEQAKAEAAAAQKAAEAELKKLKEEAEKAKAKAEKEAAKAKAEAEAAIKAAAEEAKKAAKEAEDAAKKANDAPKASKSSKLEGALPGVFTLKDGKKIRFAQGNLQFNPKKYEFRFAKEQYETLGKEANEKCAPNYDGWIDIFGWGTSGYMGCQPFEDDLNEKDYGPASGDLTGENANYDWGVYNPITNGGNKEGLWRTPTSEEMRYILAERPNAAKLKLKCMVCGVEGFIIMPDDFWSIRLRFPIEISSTDPKDNQFDKDQWEFLESVGVLFIPSSCYKYFESWSSRWYWYADSSFWTTTRMYHATYNGISTVTRRWHKFPVRLVKDVK